jgi:Asp-tRNA(Asn)/Glu-tRNA(Gln) amidotransferase C subunit
MAKDWRLIAKATGLKSSESELEKIQTTLQTLESQFGSLMEKLPHDTEPVVLCSCSEEEDS